MISVCIPTYNLGEKSLVYLKECLDSINMQTYSNIEVCVSDNSVDYDISDFIQGYVLKPNISLKYVRTEEGRGWGAVPNTNNAMKHCSGDYIKILFQDDKLANPESLQIIVDCLQDNEWCAVESVYQKDTSLDCFFAPGNFPRIKAEHPQSLLKGDNSIGGPTSVAFLKTDLRMDESLRWLNDCDFYHMLWGMWGPPTIIRGTGPLVVQRLRKDALSDTIPQSDKLKEQDYLLRKHER